MHTDDLIGHLTDNLKATPPGGVPRAIVSGLMLGLGLALLLLLLAYGLRDDLRAAFFSWPFWLKWMYAIALSLSGFILCERLARSGAAPVWQRALPLLPMLLLLLIAGANLAALPAVARRTAWLGHSALYCPWNIGLLSLPVFAGLCWVLRRAAPTQLRWAGFAAGLLSGGIAAFVYGLFCNESSVAFVATWYTLGMLLPAILGAIAGPRLLRW